ncbi:MAG TPA: alpha-amylase family glycosyl hydrolase [Anaerolineaceae bacterium]|jgi:glycosidase
MQDWSADAIFYHIYPLGFCGAPARNDFSAAPTPRLEKVYTWLDHIAGMGFNALYLGPLFESSTHGYDTADLYNLDRRLGTNATLADLADELHRRGIRLVLDGVFNHVGRDFWAFRDVREHGESSPFRDWFAGLRFDRANRRGDPFSYENWNGYDDLVKLNLGNPEARAHLLGAVEGWIRNFGIDGLRLDAADAVDLDFQRELAAMCRRLRTDFWLMGEIVLGDYRRWVYPEGLDSATNYEAYKGLYSSHNEHNYFEIAYSLSREFGEGGIYQGMPLYNFVDNHDVNRVASQLINPAHLTPLYTLLLCMPGIPSVYYGSEFGVGGVKGKYTDAPLRPAFDLGALAARPPRPELPGVISRLIRLRQSQAALRRGGYRQVHVAGEQMAFLREWGEERVLVAVNAADQPVTLDLAISGLPQAGGWVDLLGGGSQTRLARSKTRLGLPAYGARVMGWRG